MFIQEIQKREEYAEQMLWDVHGEIKDILGEKYMPEYMDYEGIKYNSRLKRVVAQCIHRRMSFGPPAYRFEVSELFFQLNYDSQVNTLAHEWIHAILAYIGIHESHGTYFKRVMNKLNANGFNISVHADFDELMDSGITVTPGTKYILRCDKCGRTWDFYRMCKKVRNASNYKHTGCGGSLTRVR